MRNLGPINRNKDIPTKGYIDDEIVKHKSDSKAHPLATSNTDGFMYHTDKEKLDTVEWNATYIEVIDELNENSNKNQLPSNKAITQKFNMLEPNIMREIIDRTKVFDFNAYVLDIDSKTIKVNDNTKFTRKYIKNGFPFINPTSPKNSPPNFDNATNFILDVECIKNTTGAQEETWYCCKQTVCCINSNDVPHQWERYYYENELKSKFVWSEWRDVLSNVPIRYITSAKDFDIDFNLSSTDPNKVIFSSTNISHSIGSRNAPITAPYTYMLTVEKIAIQGNESDNSKTELFRQTFLGNSAGITDISLYTAAEYKRFGIIKAEDPKVTWSEWEKIDNSSDDHKVIQDFISGADYEYPILCSTDKDHTQSTTIDKTLKLLGFTINPKTRTITANKFKGDLEGTASSVVQDYIGDSDIEYPILCSTDITHTTDTTKTGILKDINITVNPNTNTITSDTFKGKLDGQIKISKSNSNNTYPLLFSWNSTSGNLPYTGVNTNDGLYYNPYEKKLTTDIFNGKLSWDNVTDKPSIPSSREYVPIRYISESMDFNTSFQLTSADPNKVIFTNTKSVLNNNSPIGIPMPYILTVEKIYTNGVSNYFKQTFTGLMNAGSESAYIVEYQRLYICTASPFWTSWKKCDTAVLDTKFDTAGSGLTADGTTIKHTDIYPGTGFGNSLQQKYIKWGDTISVPWGSVNSSGHLTTSGTVDVVLPELLWNDITDKPETFPPETHSHNYAASTYAGGAALSANKLNTDAGSATNPIYFSNGVPVATTYTLNKSVPSDAAFTDTMVTSRTDTSDNEYRLLLSWLPNDTENTNIVGKNSKFTANPSTGVLSAPIFNGKISWDNVTDKPTIPSGGGGESDHKVIQDFISGADYEYPILCSTDKDHTQSTTIDKTLKLLGFTINPKTRTITANKFKGDLEGTASSANYLNTSAGSATKPVYFSNGIPVAGTYTLGTACARSVKTVTTKAHTNYGTDDNYVPDMKFLSFWNGAYNSSGKSNLTYCTKGAFGTACTKGVDTTATSGSSNLITSGAMYSALSGKASSSHTHNYLPLSGGALNKDAIIDVPYSGDGRVCRLTCSGIKFSTPTNAWVSSLNCYSDSDFTTSIGSIGVFGTGDIIKHYYVGGSHDSPLLKVDTSGNVTFKGVIGGGQKLLYQSSSANTSSLNVTVSGLFTSYSVVVCSMITTSGSYCITLPLRYIKSLGTSTFLQLQNILFYYVNDNTIQIKTGLGQSNPTINNIRILSIY